MFQKWLLIAFAAIALAGCAAPKSKPIVTAKYYEKPKLSLPNPERPEIKTAPKWIILPQKNLVCTTKDEFKNFSSDLKEIYKYQLRLETNLNSYKKYYETKK